MQDLPMEICKEIFYKLGYKNLMNMRIVSTLYNQGWQYPSYNIDYQVNFFQLIFLQNDLALNFLN